VVAERLRGFLELGLTALNFLPVGPDPAVRARRLARELPPALPAGG
jgi:hypothetical protein